jgi:hypothetical protein
MFPHTTQITWPSRYFITTFTSYRAKQYEFNFELIRSQLGIYMWRQLTLTGIYNGLNSHDTNSGTLSCNFPKPFKFTEHNLIASNIKPSNYPSIHPRFLAWSLLWRTRAVRSVCSHNKRWRLISQGYRFSWNQSMSYQWTSECRNPLIKCW